MDYRKTILYLIIILGVLGYLYKSKQDEKNRAERSEKFASVYAATSVMAELFRLEPEGFRNARDSIYNVYNFNADSIDAFRQTFENREEEWNDIWLKVRSKTDSLIAYFRANPVVHNSDSVDVVSDSDRPR